MFFRRKTCCITVALTSYSLFAGTIGSICKPDALTLPCQYNAWQIGIKALYLQPTVSNGIYAWFAYNEGGTQTDSNWNAYAINPKWGWGFMVEAAYFFDKGKDLNLNWYHYAKNYYNSFGGTNFFADPIYGVETAINVFKPTWDSVNFEIGQRIDFNDMNYLRLHAGLEYARIRVVSNIYGTSTVANYGPYFNAHDQNIFNGIGPRLGFDGFYSVNNGFMIYAKLAAGMLTGNSKLSISDTLTNNLGTQTYSAKAYASQHQNVPELEAKLGISYQCGISQGEFILDAGWMWAQYLNAITYQNLSVGTAFTPASTTVAGAPLTAAFAISGPYVGIRWTGNI